MAGLPTFDGFTDLIGLPEIRTLEGRFGATGSRPSAESPRSAAY